MAYVDCDTFLRAIFQDNETIWVTHFKGDPNDDGQARWGGKPLKLNGKPIEQIWHYSGSNAYLSQSSFSENARKRVIEQAENVRFLILDDVNPNTDFALQPSWLLQTSKNSWQAGFILTDGHRKAAAGALIKDFAFYFGKNDKSGNNIVRYCRVPGSVNGKPGTGEGFEAKLRDKHWHPENRYTLGKIRRAFKIPRINAEQETIDIEDFGGLSGLEDDEEKVRSVLEFLNSDDCPDKLGRYSGTHRDIDEYEWWYAVGMALKATGLENAFDLWLEWSEPRKNSHKNTPRYLRGKWRSFDDDKAGGIHIGTVYMAAKEAGWDPKVKMDDGEPGEEPEPLDEQDKEELPVKEIVGMLPPVMRTIYDDMWATSEYPHGWFILGATIALSGMIIGRGVFLQNLNTAIWVKLLGDSGSGKNAPLTYSRKLLKELDIKFSRKLGSVSGGEDALMKNQGMLNLIRDEARPSNDAQVMEIVDWKNEVWSLANEWYIARDLSQRGSNAKPPKPVQFPFMGEISATTIDAQFNENSFQAMVSGEGARTLFLMTRVLRPKANPDPKRFELPPAVKKWYDAILERKPQFENIETDDDGDHDDGSIFEADPEILNLSRKAKEYIEAKRVEIDELLRSVILEPLHRVLLTRVVEYAKRFGSIVALARNPYTKTVELEDIKVGYVIFNSYIDSMIGEISKHVHSDKTAVEASKLYENLKNILREKEKIAAMKSYKKFKTYIMQNKIPRAMIMTRFRLSSANTSVIRDTLVESGKIEIVVAKYEDKQGKPQSVELWRLKRQN